VTFHHPDYGDKRVDRLGETKLGRIITETKELMRPSDRNSVCTANEQLYQGVEAWRRTCASRCVPVAKMPRWRSMLPTTPPIRVCSESPKASPPGGAAGPQQSARARASPAKLRCCTRWSVEYVGKGEGMALKGTPKVMSCQLIPARICGVPAVRDAAV
jgi:hypothetical protein